MLNYSVYSGMKMRKCNLPWYFYEYNQTYFPENLVENEEGMILI